VEQNAQVATALANGEHYYGSEQASVVKLMGAAATDKKSA
jgi:hypothetical protein